MPRVFLFQLRCFLFALSALFFVHGTLLAWKEPGWTRFRGPNGVGVTEKSPVSLPWNEQQVHRIALPGVGHGSPVVYGDTAFLMSADPTDATRFVLAVDLDKGKTLWQKSYPSLKHTLHKFSSYASSTPCLDDQRVYVAWADPEHTMVKAYSHQGDEVWGRDFGRYVSQHGFGTSPILVDDLLIVLNSQDAEELPAGVEPGYDRMTAMNRATGETVWETRLPTSRVCYGVPCLWEHSGKKQLVCSTTSQGMFGMDPATGELLWSHDCFTQRVCASSIVVNNLLIGSHGSGGGRDNRLVAYDLVTQKEKFRVTRSAPYVPTPVAAGDSLYLWSDAGIVSCVDLSSGETLWSKRIGGDYSGSPVILGSVLVNVSHNGTVHFLRASHEFESLGSFETNVTVRSTVVPASNKLLIRSESELLVIKP